MSTNRKPFHEDPAQPGPGEVVPWERLTAVLPPGRCEICVLLCARARQAGAAGTGQFVAERPWGVVLGSLGDPAILGGLRFSLPEALAE